MKRNYVRVVLEPVNEAQVELAATEDLITSDVYPLVKLIAQVLDLKAQGEDIWLSIGGSKDNSSLSVAVHDGSQTSFANGADLRGLCMEIRKLL